MPHIDDLLDQVDRKWCFPLWMQKVDTGKSRWSLGLGVWIKLHLFVIHIGIYDFEVIPFVLCSVSATFQRLVQKVLPGLELFCSVCMLTSLCPLTQ